MCVFVISNNNFFIFDPKILLQILLFQKSTFLYWIFGKGGGGGITPIRNISLQISVSSEKKRNIVFRNEGGGGGVKGHLEIFRKFIQIF